MTELRALTLPTKILTTAPINDLIAYRDALGRMPHERTSWEKYEYLLRLTRLKAKANSKDRKRLKRLLAK